MILWILVFRGDNNRVKWLRRELRFRGREQEEEGRGLSVTVVSNRNDMMIHEYDRKEGRKSGLSSYVIGIFYCIFLGGKKKKKFPSARFLRNNMSRNFWHLCL